MRSRRSFLAMVGALPFASTVRPTDLVVDSCSSGGAKIVASAIWAPYIQSTSIPIHRLGGFTKVYDNG